MEEVLTMAYKTYLLTAEIELLIHDNVEGLPLTEDYLDEHAHNKAKALMESIEKPRKVRIMAYDVSELSRG